MTEEIYRGVVRDGVVVFCAKTPPLADLTEVEIKAIAPLGDLIDLIGDADKLDQAPGVPSVVLAAVEGAPRVPTDWVDELEQLIAEGRRPPTRTDPFEEGA